MKAENVSENQQSCWSLSSWQSGFFYYGRETVILM